MSTFLNYAKFIIYWNSNQYTISRSCVWTRSDPIDGTSIFLLKFILFINFFDFFFIFVLDCNFQWRHRACPRLFTDYNQIYYSIAELRCISYIMMRFELILFKIVSFCVLCMYVFRHLFVIIKHNLQLFQLLSAIVHRGANVKQKHLWWNRYICLHQMFCKWDYRLVFPQ